MIAVSAFDDASTETADIVFPAESYAEKEGTVTHPDGRLQRLRPAVHHPGNVHPIWQVLAELGAARPRNRDRLGPGGGRRSPAEVPFYAGITPGDRWQGRAVAGAPRRFRSR